MLSAGNLTAPAAYEAKFLNRISEKHWLREHDIHRKCSDERHNTAISIPLGLKLSAVKSSRLDNWGNGSQTGA